MRLQTENRRHSVAPIEVPRTGLPLPFGSPPSSKRASFTPLTGTPNARVNGHMRLSSVSDISITDDGQGQVLTLSDMPTPASNRMSGFFGRSSPPRDLPPSSLEFDALKKELVSVRTELEETRAELSEATEAREASETCVKTLRDFINENNIGSGRVEGPPVVSGDTNSPTSGKKPGGWGFGLWKVDTTVGSVPPGNTNISPSDPTATPTTATPFSRKIGGLFARQPSVSSNESNTRQSMDARSDTSSVKDAHS